MPTALLISVFASQAVVDSGSILPAIVLHSMNTIVGQSLDSLYQSTRHGAVVAALGVALLGITLAHLWREDVRRWFAAIHQSLTDFVANLKDILRKVLREWSYIVLSAVILLNIIAFFVPGE